MTDAEVFTLEDMANDQRLETGDPVTDARYAAALRAALALTERRCGNCGHWQGHGQGYAQFHGCASHGGRTLESDGCLLGWVAKP